VDAGQDGRIMVPILAPISFVVVNWIGFGDAATCIQLVGVKVRMCFDRVDSLIRFSADDV
jgi:hypothetical protein